MGKMGEIKLLWQKQSIRTESFPALIHIEKDAAHQQWISWFGASLSYNKNYKYSFKRETLSSFSQGKSKSFLPKWP